MDERGDDQVHGHHAFEFLIDGIDAFHLLIASHMWPFLLQLDSRGMIHNDILATNTVH